MYKNLTPQWAGTLLGLLEVITIPIPFMFWKYGGRIRARSRVIRQLREDQERMEDKRARGLAKLEKRRARLAALHSQAEEGDDQGREEQAAGLEYRPEKEKEAETSVTATGHGSAK